MTQIDSKIKSDKVPSFSVVVISYDGRDFLRKSLKGLEQSAWRPNKIIVIDDHSSDDSGAMVQKEFPYMEYIYNENNIGPTASRNRGAKLALGEYVVFLDNDIIVRPDSLKRLISFLDATKDAGMVGGKLLNKRGEKIFWNMGYRPNFIRAAIGKILYFFLQPFLARSTRARDFLMNFSLNYWDYDRSIPVGWVIESFIAVRLELFIQVHGFDEQFFMFHEGPDLSDRLREIGYQTYFVHNALVTMLEGHVHSLAKRKKMFRTSTWRYYKKHYFHF